MIVYKIDVIDELKKIGVTYASVRKTKVFSQSTLKKFKEKDTNISMDNINKLCCLLELQPRDIFKYIETQEDMKIFEENISKKG